ncbi:pyridoxamine 5'-phosphate oxidase family protein [Nitrosopumilus piranensis]|nr:pyridoxamine 5'-phosphate oxidase family protein [Nitrosopumilus piranensis]
MQKSNPSKIDYMLSDTKIPIRLAFIKPDGFPNILSLWYEEINGKIFCATQKSAKIVSYIQKNPSCGFEIAADNPPYKGVRGSGTARILENKGQEILNILMKKYLGEKESTLSKFLKEHSSNEVGIEITPSKIFNYDYSKRMRDV